MAILKINCSVKSPFKGNVPDKKYHDDTAIEDVISYCLQTCKIPSHCIGGIGINVDYAAAQMTFLAKVYGKEKGVRLRHMILLFEPGERISVRNAGQLAFLIAQYYGTCIDFG